MSRPRASTHGAAPLKYQEPVNGVLDESENHKGSSPESNREGQGGGDIHVRSGSCRGHRTRDDHIQRDCLRSEEPIKLGYSYRTLGTALDALAAYCDQLDVPDLSAIYEPKQTGTPSRWKSQQEKDSEAKRCFNKTAWPGLS
jgi:hypothetical protein